MPTDKPSDLTTGEVRKKLIDATSVVYDVGYKWPLLELCMLIWEKGIPSREERERLLAEKLENAQAVQEGSDLGTTPPHSPS
jgi:hypothetical protein